MDDKTEFHSAKAGGRPRGWGNRKARSHTPFDNLHRPGPNLHVGATRRGRVVPPVDDVNGTGRAYGVSRFAQKANGFFTMEDIEKQAGVLRLRRDPETLHEYVALFAENVAKPLGCGPLCRPFHHVGVNVKGSQYAGNPTRYR